MNSMEAFFANVIRGCLADWAKAMVRQTKQPSWALTTHMEGANTVWVVMPDGTRYQIIVEARDADARRRGDPRAHNA